MKALDVNQQVICPRCEELVHRMSSSCPYCQHDLTLPYIADEFLQGSSSPQISHTKITPMPHAGGIKNPNDEQVGAPVSRHPSVQNSVQIGARNVPQHDIGDSLPASPTFFRSLVPLVSLISGTFFLFFGLLVKLFQQDGYFTLRWSVESWPYFVFPASILMMVGLWTLETLSVPELSE